MLTCQASPTWTGPSTLPHSNLPADSAIALSTFMCTLHSFEYIGNDATLQALDFIDTIFHLLKRLATLHLFGGSIYSHWFIIS